MSTREPTVAGTFYPASKAEILQFIIEHKKKPIKTGPLHGIIVPHAGWVYSGETALHAYALLEKIKPEKIALLGPSHYFPITSCISDPHETWVTPMGDVRIIKDDFFQNNTGIHAPEHSIEVQFPFIRHFSPESKVLPLVTGDITTDYAQDVAEHLIEEDYFIIISTDLSHFYTEKQANELDKRSIEQITRLDTENIDACGINPLKICFAMCRKLQVHPTLLEYTTSAKTSGDSSRVVGYASYWF